MSAQIGADFMKMTCYDKYWRSGALGLITIKNIIVRNLLSPVITSFLFSLPSSQARPLLSLEIFRSSIDFCPLIVFVLTTQLELSGL